jgi:hypothetical protein
VVITEQRLEQALTFIAESDQQIGHWRAEVLRSEFLGKSAEALAFKSAAGTSAEERKQSAKLTPEVAEAWERHFKAVLEYEKLKAQRERQYIVIELYRTMSANLRRGQV